MISSLVLPVRRPAPGLLQRKRNHFAIIPVGNRIAEATASIPSRPKIAFIFSKSPLSELEQRRRCLLRVANLACAGAC